MDGCRRDTAIILPDNGTETQQNTDPLSGSPRIAGPDVISGVDRIILRGFDFNSETKALATVQIVSDHGLCDAAETRIRFASVTIRREQDFVLMETG